MGSHLSKKNDVERTCTSGKGGLAQANNYMAVHLHRSLVKGKGNVFFSPFSLSTAMTMLLCATKEKSESDLRKVLGYDHAGMEKDDIVSAFQELMDSFMKTNDSYTLSSANSLVCQRGFKMKEQYKSVFEKSFQALFVEANFAETSKVVQMINDWVNEKTNGMIPDFISTIHPSNILVILNAVYFKGSWVFQFDKDKTFKQNFYKKGDKNQAKLVEMMHMEESLPFVEKETFQALQLPYVGKEIAMLLLLPRNMNGLGALEDILTPTFIQDLNANMRERKVHVGLPRFRLEYDEDVVSHYEQLLVKLSHDTKLDSANNFGRIPASSIVHKAVLEVNEEGSEACAATMIAMRSRPCLDPEFIVDHPFAFVIYDVESNMILFMGRVEEL